jgi:hypothetical protein
MHYHRHLRQNPTDLMAFLGRVIDAINDAYIVLIPKVKHPSQVIYLFV